MDYYSFFSAPLNGITAAIVAVPAVSGGAAAIAAAPAVFRDRYDFTAPVPRPANNAANTVLKEFELQTHNKATVFKAYYLKSRSRRYQCFQSISLRCWNSVCSRPLYTRGYPIKSTHLKRLHHHHRSVAHGQNRYYANILSSG